MKSDEPELTRRQAIDMMKVTLQLNAKDVEVLSVAAYGLRWRNARIAELERQVVRLGGWPWNRKRKRTSRK